MTKLYCLSFLGEVFPYFCEDIWKEACRETKEDGFIYKAWVLDITEGQVDLILANLWVPEIPEN